MGDGISIENAGSELGCERKAHAELTMSETSIDSLSCDKKG